MREHKENKFFGSSFWNVPRNRKEYYQKYPEEVALFNFNVIRLLASLAAILLVIFIAMSQILIPEWHLSVGYVSLFFVMIAIVLLTLACPDNVKYNFKIMKWISVAYIIVIVGYMVAIDLFTVNGISAVFLPCVYIVVSAMIIIPWPMIVGVLSVYEGIFIYGTFALKSVEVASTDVLSSMVGLIFAITTGLFLSGMISNDHVMVRHYKRLSNVDGLTGILNKKAAEEAVKTYLKEKDKNEPGALLIIDVDNFKLINDTYGHIVGDEVLEQVGDMLFQCFRASDIVGRVGGDEFIVYMKTVDNKRLIKMKSEDILRAMKLIDIPDEDVEVSATIGAAMISCGRWEYQEVFNAADEMLYVAKRNGKGYAEIKEVTREE